MNSFVYSCVCACVLLVRYNRGAWVGADSVRVCVCVCVRDFVFVLRHQTV